MKTLLSIHSSEAPSGSSCSGIRRKARLAASMLMALGTAALMNTANGQESCDSATIYFPVSHWRIDPQLGNNAAELDSLASFMTLRGKADSIYTLRSVRVVGSASPEGSISFNEQLSRRRAESIFDYFSQRESIPDSVTSFEFLGRDWQGLRQLVEADTRVPYRSEVLELLDDMTASGRVPATMSDTGLARLRRMNGGAAYRYLLTNVFPQLRASKLYVEYSEKPVPVLPADTVATELTDTVPVPVVIEEEVEEEVVFKTCKPFYMDVKTNLVYDALAVPAIGVEFYVGKNWSVGANWMYGWWDKDSRHRYWRAYGGDLNVRRWLGRRAAEKSLTGHHLGVYAGVITYDFEFGGKGYMGGLPHKTLWDRCNWYAGVEYGYTLPVSRRINFDFTIGLGYMGGKYLEYVPKGKKYIWQETKRLNWFGPTKVEISLVWLIGCNNYNRSMKGGLK